MNYEWLSIHEVIKKGKNLDTETSYNDYFDVDDYVEKADRVNGIVCLYEDSNFKKLLNGIVYEIVDGDVKYYSRYKNGVKDGEEVFFYNTGEIKTYTRYKKGILNGEYISFNKDGSYQLRYYGKNFFILIMAVYDNNGNEYMVFKNKNLKNCKKGKYEDIIKDIDKNFSDTLQKSGIIDDDFELCVFKPELTLECLKKYNPIQAKKINRPYSPSYHGFGTHAIGSIIFYDFGHYRDKEIEDGGRRINGYVYNYYDINYPIDIINMQNGYVNGEATNYNNMFFPGKLIIFKNYKYNQQHGVFANFDNWGCICDFSYWLCDKLILKCKIDENGKMKIVDNEDVPIINIKQYLKDRIKSIKEDVTFLKVYSRQIEMNAKMEKDSDYKIYFPL